MERERETEKETEKESLFLRMFSSKVSLANGLKLRLCGHINNNR